MPNETYDVNRHKEIIDICLKKFIEKGLYETTSRDLTDALNMRPSALYYHFKSKDDAVLECAEEAAIRLEEALLLPSINLMDDPDSIKEQPPDAAAGIQAMIRFLAQVCSANKYQEQMKPILSRMREREYAYCESFAGKLGCLPEELAPWFFAVIASTESYMIFGKETYSVRPLDFVKKAIRFFKKECAQKAIENNQVKESLL